jgi:hypothetical protein
MRLPLLVLVLAAASELVVGYYTCDHGTFAAAGSVDETNPPPGFRPSHSVLPKLGWRLLKQYVHAQHARTNPSLPRTSY